MKHSQKLLYAACSIMAVVVISMIGYNIFSAHNEAYVDKHIRELKYEQAQVHKDENQSIEEKLNGQKDFRHQEKFRQEDELPPEGRQEA